MDNKNKGIVKVALQNLRNATSVLESLTLENLTRDEIKTVFYLNKALDAAEKKLNKLRSRPTAATRRKAGIKKLDIKKSNYSH